MIAQMIGSRKSRSTQKLERLLKELGLKYHMVYLEDRKLSEGELTNIFQFYKPSDIMDRDSPAFKKKNLAFLDYDAREEITADNLLLQLPILRLAKKVYLNPTREIVIKLLKNTS